MVMNHDTSSHANGEISQHDSSNSNHPTVLRGGSNEEILFQNLSTTSLGGFIFACIVIAVLAFMMEISRYYIMKLENNLLVKCEGNKSGTQDYSTFSQKGEIKTQEQSIDNNCCRQQSDQEQQAETDLFSNSLVSSTRNISLRSPRLLWLLTLLGYFITNFMSFMFMLIAMTYNIYLILSVCFGLSCGKLLSVYLKRYTNTPLIDSHQMHC